MVDSTIAEGTLSACRQTNMSILRTCIPYSLCILYPAYVFVAAVHVEPRCQDVTTARLPPPFGHAFPRNRNSNSRETDPYKNILQTPPLLRIAMATYPCDDSIMRNRFQHISLLCSKFPHISRMSVGGQSCGRRILSPGCVVGRLSRFGNLTRPT